MPKPEVRLTIQVTKHYAPDLPRQVQALLRLLGNVDPGPETPQPQDHVGPRAATLATVGSGRNLSEDINDDSRLAPYRK